MQKHLDGTTGKQCLQIASYLDIRFKDHPKEGGQKDLIWATVAELDVIRARVKREAIQCAEGEV